MTLPWDRRVTGRLEAASRNATPKIPKTNNDGIHKSRPPPKRSNSFASSVSDSLNGLNEDLDTIRVSDMPPPYDTAESSSGDYYPQKRTPQDTAEENLQETIKDEEQYFTPDLDAYPNPQMPWHPSAVHGRIASEQRWSETAKMPATRQPILQKPEDLSNIDPALRSHMPSVNAPPVPPMHSVPISVQPQNTAVFRSTTAINNDRHAGIRNAPPMNKGYAQQIPQMPQIPQIPQSKSMYDFYQQLERQRLMYQPNNYFLQPTPLLNPSYHHPPAHPNIPQQVRQPTGLDKFRAAQMGARINPSGGVQKVQTANPNVNANVRPQRRPGTAFSAQYIKAGLRASMMKNVKSAYPYPPNGQRPVIITPGLQFPPIPPVAGYPVTVSMPTIPNVTLGGPILNIPLTVSAPPHPIPAPVSRV